METKMISYERRQQIKPKVTYEDEVVKRPKGNFNALIIYENNVKLLAIFPDRNDFYKARDFLRNHYHKQVFSLKEVIDIFKYLNGYVYFLTPTQDTTQFIENLLVVGQTDNYYLAIFDSESTMRKAQMFVLNNKKMELESLVKYLWDNYDTQVIVKTRGVWKQ